MRGPYPQSHVTLRYCGHVTNKKRYISTFTRPMDPKLSRVVTQDEGTSPTKSRDTSTTWSRDKSKALSLISQGLWTQNLANWGLRMRGSQPQSHMTLRHLGHLTNINRFISTFIQCMDPKLSRVGTQDEGNPPTK